jgi:RNA polymerase sigma-70 factor (ECF subfamily)
MYQVTRNAVADHHRARARHAVVAERGDGAAKSDELYTLPVEPEGGIGECELAANLAPLIARLASPYREAITLVELEGQTQIEAARLSGISLSGMKSRVQRGRRRLKEILEDCCTVAVDMRGQILSAEPREPSCPGCCR